MHNIYTNQKQTKEITLVKPRSVDNNLLLP
jgi:hypothetical protein